VFEAAIKTAKADLFEFAARRPGVAALKELVERLAYAVVVPDLSAVKTER
jgi:hypothetical protein